ncbi:MAG: arsenate reductase ArsC [Gammaproteobacteria bacterium]|nr:arsenate reductase ArsC [Gammaproteobacteria bacterium]MDP2139830.1 arsenate reductase ArsC [Gammaproteobacteria bacterium]MDP2347070.1 arsenate reductase ArsC [Gammaproteobacteria bacterium]
MLLSPSPQDSATLHGNVEGRRFQVLVLCTGNSARSILAEALFNELGGDLFRAWSAGSHPTGRVNPFALELLEQEGFDCSGFRSKSWDEFTGAPHLDFVVTVCGNAAAENCPSFAGEFQRIHWGLPDPAELTADPAAARQAFRQCFDTLRARIIALLELPEEQRSKSALTQQMRALAA